MAYRQSSQMPSAVSRARSQSAQKGAVVDAMMPAGDHSAPFRGRGLPAGLYFAMLRVDGATFTRNLVHVP